MTEARLACVHSMEKKGARNISGHRATPSQRLLGPMYQELEKYILKGKFRKRFYCKILVKSQRERKKMRSRVAGSGPRESGTIELLPEGIL